MSQAEGPSDLTPPMLKRRGRGGIRVSHDAKPQLCGLKRRRGFVDPIPSSFPSTNQTKPRLSWHLVMPRCEDDGDSYRLPTWLADDMSSQFWEDLEVDDWFRRAGIAEFVATFFFLYITILTVIGVCLGAICGAGAVKGFQKGVYESNGGGPTLWPPATPRAQPGRRDRRHLHPRLHRLLRHRRQEECEGLPCAGKIAIPSSSFLLRLHFMLTEQVGMQQIIATLPIGFSVFLVRLATIPITGTGINRAQSLGAAIIYSKDHAWDDHVRRILQAERHCSSSLAAMTNLHASLVVAVDLLGRPVHWSCSCCLLSPDRHQSRS
ncbi:hypothetical protein GW17_00016923 [Ensete ventricosum]|nr:hypothetical protein GW17_00016923 [Ensete ventricosum]